MALAAGTKLGRYEIRAKIGEGGMGEVYLSEDVELRRRVALKILPDAVATNPERMRRFKQEAQAAAALNHPNIAHIYEIGEAGDTRFIAMEFIDGRTLREEIHRVRTELRKLLRFLQHAAEGLARAHAAGIVHRDLKPDNIMITRDGGHAKILDFGLAKLIEQRPISGADSSELATAVMPQHSTPGAIMGTVGYMSPEQAQGKATEIDQRSDIFSFGCILFEAATGKKPFEGDSVVKSLHMVIYEPAPLLADLNPNTPAELQRIVRRCLAKDPDDRYQSIKEVAIELKELRRELEGSMDTTVPPPPKSETAGASAFETASAHHPGTISTPSSSLSPRESSAEYVVGGIKRHKVAALLVLLLLIGGGVAIAVYLGSRSNASTAIKSVAVLPFENKSGSADSEYLSDGLAESLIYRLSQLSNLKVSPRSSAFRYKGQSIDAEKIGNELGVDAVMSGRLTQRGDDLVISVDLIDVRNEKTLWGEQFQRKMSDLVATQSEIAAAIADKLQLRLSGNDSRGIAKQYTSNNEAYQFYLQGRYFWNKRSSENLKKATELLRAATEKDPNFALAYAGLADCYVVSYYYVGERPRELMPLAKTYAAKAIALDPTLAEPHTTLAFASWLLDLDKATAEKEFLRSIELNPNYPTAHHWYSRYLRGVGRTDEAIREINRAEELDPLSLVIINNVAENYVDRGDLNSAVKQIDRMFDLDPNFWAAHQTLSIVMVKQGRYAEALAEAQKSIQYSNRSNASLALLGHVYGKLGRRSEAEGVIKELEKRYGDKQADSRDLVIVYTGLDDKNKAFGWLEKAFAEHSVFMAFLKLEPLMEPLQSDPRWSDLERRVGLAQ
jgi:serine/threonine protein kinase/Tfp pilus assembly protein PilF